MPELVNIEFVEGDSMLIIGKARKGEIGKSNFGAFWGECFAENLFGKLEAELGDNIISPDYVAWMGDEQPNGAFIYLVGIQCKAGTPVPEGCQSRLIPAGTRAVTWIKGVEAEVYPVAHTISDKAIRDAGYGFTNQQWAMEVYNCPRFTAPADDGTIILDYVIPCMKL